MSTELRSRIEAAATRLGYVPNLAARTLATRRSRLIGVVVRNIADPLIASILTTFEGELAESAYGVMLTTTGGSLEQDLLATRALLSRGVQAVVYAQIGASPEIARVLANCGVPGLSLGERAPAAGIRGLSIGRREGAVLAARYLLSLGHRRLAVIARRDDDISSAMRQLPAAPDSVSIEVLEAGEDLDAAQAAIGLLLERGVPPTAVICASDAQALAALRECAIRRVAVPQRLSLVGFGDVEFARRTYPALSTIRVASAELGVRLAQAVLASLKGNESAPVDVPAKLIARESTGPALA